MAEPSMEPTGQIGAPRISENAIAEYRRLLADPGFERNHPAEYEALRASVDEALAATGQVLVPVDPRTPAQRLVDRQLGVEARKPTDYEAPVSQATDSTVTEGAKELLAALHVEPFLGNILLRDMLSGQPAPDATEVARQLDLAGIRYDEAIAEVQHAFDRTGRTSAIRPTDLSAGSLAQLYVWAQRLKQHEQRSAR